MGRTYFRKAALSAAAVGLAAFAGSLPGLARALFDSRPVQEERFAILAQAVGGDRWKLLVLEQIKARPPLKITLKQAKFCQMRARYTGCPAQKYTLSQSF